MQTYSESNAFSTAKIFDTSDQVLGGISGPDNVPLKALADRTLYLKDRLYRYDDVSALTADTTIDNTYIGKLLSCTVGSGDSNFTLTLDLLANFTLGTVIAIKATCAALKNITVKAATSQLIFLNSDYMENEIYMHDGEVLYLVRDVAYWTVIAYKGNFERVGQCVSAYTQHPGTLIRNGSLINRDAYPRLWKWVNEKLTNNQQRVTDAIWLSDPGALPVYRGLFSTGNGTTSLRLPDDRGMFDRYLDSGRGLDTDRIHTYAGGFEQYEIQQHRHTRNSVGAAEHDMRSNALGGGNSLGGGPYHPVSQIYTGNAGGSETRPMNNAKIPLIIF
jgi:hypothetical protein